jgi:hypothetical protein
VHLHFSCEPQRMSAPPRPPLLLGVTDWLLFRRSWPRRTPLCPRPSQQRSDRYRTGRSWLRPREPRPTPGLPSAAPRGTSGLGATSAT